MPLMLSAHAPAAPLPARPRAPRACAVCHARKVRCDVTERSPCLNCENSGAECSFRRSPTNETPEAGDVTVCLNCGLRVDEALEACSLCREPRAHFFQPLLFAAERRNLNNDIMYGTQNHSGYYSPPAPAHVEDMELQILNIRGAFRLPSWECCMEAISAFFMHIHPVMPIFNKTQLFAQLHDPLNPPPLLLLQSLLVAGLRVVPLSLRVFFQEFGKRDRDDISHELYRRAKALYDAQYEREPITLIQLLCLLSWYFDGPDDVTRNLFYWMRIAISLAQGFGFQRDILHSQLREQWEIKLWRKVWWVLFVRDRQVAVAFGRPIAIDLDDCDVPMISEADFEEDGAVTLSLQSRYFIEATKLAEIVGIVIKQQYSVRALHVYANNSLPIIQHCDFVLGNWVNQLPSELQFSLAPGHPSQTEYLPLWLHVQYHTILSLVHRTNLLHKLRGETLRSSNYPFKGIGLQLAYMVSILAQQLRVNRQLRVCPSNVCYTLFSAGMAIVQAANNRRVAPNVRKLLRGAFGNIVACCQDVAPIWGFGQLAYQVLLVLIQTEEETEESDNKRIKMDSPEMETPPSEMKFELDQNPEFNMLINEPPVDSMLVPSLLFPNWEGPPFDFADIEASSSLSAGESVSDSPEVPGNWLPFM